jgi:major vault protein
MLSAEVNEVLQHREVYAPDARLRSRAPGAAALPATDGSSRLKGSVMQESRQGKPQDAMLGDVAERKSTYNEPRTLTFANKYKGVPTIKVQGGYAVSVAKVDGAREILVGPTTWFVEYGETLDVLSLSTGKPKTTNKLFHTAYLRVANNTVSDIVLVETSDHVGVELKLAYNVNFEGDCQKWFSIENYIKHMCDHVRSVLKGKIRKINIEDFFTNSTDIIRNIILGEPKEGQPRAGMLFQSNGMRIADVEVLVVDLKDPAINDLLSKAQREAVETNVNLARRKKTLDFTLQSETMNRTELDAKAETDKKKTEISAGNISNELFLNLKKVSGDLDVETNEAEVIKARQEKADIDHAGALRRAKSAGDQNMEMKRRDIELNIGALSAETKALVDKMNAIQPGLVEGLLMMSRNDIVGKMADAAAPQVLFGGKNVVDVMQQMFGSLPSVKKALEGLGVQMPGNGPSKQLPGVSKPV